MSYEQDPSQDKNKGMHVCPQCESELVQPEQWENTKARNKWRVWLRCPECEHREDGEYDERAVDDYDAQLDLGTAKLSETLKGLEHENMAAMLGSFTTALERDLITPDDFGTRRAI